MPFLVANGMVGLKEVMDGVKATTGKREIMNLKHLVFIIIFHHYSSIAILVMAFISLFIKLLATHLFSGIFFICIFCSSLF